MCWFITAVVPARLEPTLRATARAARLGISSQENASIAARLAAIDRAPPDPRLWSVTHGGCSCDLVVARGPDPTVGLRSDATELLASLAELGQPIAFVIHTYRGTLDERFEVAKGPRLEPAEVRADDARFPPDALCVVRVIPRRS